MLTTFIAGALTGLFFRPMALIPVALVYMLVIMVDGSEHDAPMLIPVVLGVIALNVGFLLGAVTRWQISRRDGGNPA